MPMTSASWSRWDRTWSGGCWHGRCAGTPSTGSCWTGTARSSSAEPACGSAVEVAQGAAALVAGLGLRLRGRRAGLAAGGGLPGAGGRGAAGRGAPVGTGEPGGGVELRERLLRLRGGHRSADTDSQGDQADVPRAVVGPARGGGCGDAERHHEDQQRGGRNPEPDEHQPLVVLDLLLRQRHVRRAGCLGRVVAARDAVATTRLVGSETAGSETSRSALTGGGARRPASRC